ncbi:MAG: cupin domain-containing protein [Microthrixaceae bacterium]
MRREFHREAPRLGDLSDLGGAGPGEPLGTAPRHLPARVAEVHRTDPEAWWDDLLTRSPRAPAYRMVKEGEVLPRSLVCRRSGVGHQQLDDLIEPNRVLESYDDGASLVLQGLQHTDPAMARLSNNLALELDQPVQLNAYLSPASARGLDLHFDYHDVIVVQLSGTKAWRVWAPLDRSRLPQKRGPGIPKPTWDEVGDPVIETVVHPGDVLVIPRGHPHAAATIDDESAHLTIGIMSLTWQALIAMRLRDTAGGPALASTFHDAEPARSNALADLRAELSPDALARAHRLEVWRRQPRTRLRPRRCTFDPDADLAFTPGPLLWLDDPSGEARSEPSDDGRTHPPVSLQLGDRAITLPAAATPLLEILLAAEGAFGVASLMADPRHGLDGPSVRAILAALHREGVVSHGPL